MSAIPQESQPPGVVTQPKKRFVMNEQVTSFLLLLPSFIVTAIFVYFFISSTFYVSLSNWRTLKRDMTLREPVYQTYVDMFAMPRFQSDIRNTIVFTIMFMTLAIILGLTLAILLDRQIFASPIFRNMFLFPYALSFVVTGVAWRWIFNPETGINLFFEIMGINALMVQMGMDPIKPGWATNPEVVLQINSLLAAILPGVDKLQIKWGVPLALIPVAIAATWQLSGFVMAMYLGGMATISNDIREAARIDGATEWQIYRRVVIPILKPVTISVAVILLHVSLKIFDLVFTMSGVGPGFATDVPAIFVFEMMFKATRYNLGAAASIVMLVFVGFVIIPYLASTLREGER
jgi:glucose/mannose transport system permease protein